LRCIFRVKTDYVTLYPNMSFILKYLYIFFQLFLVYYNKTLCLVFARGVDLNIALEGGGTF